MHFTTLLKETFTFTLVIYRSTVFVSSFELMFFHFYRETSSSRVIGSSSVVHLGEVVSSVVLVESVGVISLVVRALRTLRWTTRQRRPTKFKRRISKKVNALYWCDRAIVGSCDCALLLIVLFHWYSPFKVRRPSLGPRLSFISGKTIQLNSPRLPLQTGF